MELRHPKYMFKIRTEDGLKEISENLKYLQKGVSFRWSELFAKEIDGYSKGSVVCDESGVFYYSKVDRNFSNPSTDDSWESFRNFRSHDKLLGNNNLNDYKGDKEGIYYQNTDAKSTTSLNYPVLRAGTLVVYKHVANISNGCIQMYYPHMDNETTYEPVLCYYRVYRDTGWSLWKMIKDHENRLNEIDSTIVILDNKVETYKKETDNKITILDNKVDTNKKETDGRLDAHDVTLNDHEKRITSNKSEIDEIRYVYKTNEYGGNWPDSGIASGVNRELRLYTPKKNMYFWIRDDHTIGTHSLDNSNITGSLSQKNWQIKYDGQLVNTWMYSNQVKSVALGSANLNDYKGEQEGTYYQNSNAYATASRNYPVTKAGALHVLKNGANGSNGCTQMYYLFDDDKYYTRRYLAASGTWTEWKTGGAGLGVGQSWRRRSDINYGTTYTNSSGLPMLMIVTAANRGKNGNTLTCKINNLNVVFIRDANTDGWPGGSGTILIPDGSTYQLTGGTMTNIENVYTLDQ